VQVLDTKEQNNAVTFSTKTVVLYCSINEINLAINLCIKMKMLFTITGWDRKLRNAVYHYMHSHPHMPPQPDPDHNKEPLLYIRKAQVMVMVMRTRR
jgi:hypothetical protein